FATLARIEVASAAVGLSIALGSALAGGGVLSLAIGTVSASMTSSLLSLLLLSKGFRPQPQFHLKAIQPYFAFGLFSAGENIVGALNRQMEILIGGLTSTSAALGLFAVPRELSLKASTLINPVVNRVGFPLMTTIREEKNLLRTTYLEVIKISAALNFPIYGALLFFAVQIVLVLRSEEHRSE